MMTYSEALSDKLIAISVSDSPDLAPLGMSEAHLRDATAELARHLLALGARIAYGGDLRKDGFTELLFELVARHRRDADQGDDRSAVLSYLAWPVHASMPAHDLRRYAEELRDLAGLILLDPEGGTLDQDQRQQLIDQNVPADEWADSLTAMRRRMTADANARIVAGGQVAQYKGAMPGIAEEAMLALSDGRPLYVLGGFGGCAADIAVTMGFRTPAVGAYRDWNGRDAFAAFERELLRNGLTQQENETLAGTPHVDEAIALILRGLLRLESQVQAR